MSPDRPMGRQAAIKKLIARHEERVSSLQRDLEIGKRKFWHLAQEQGRIKEELKLELEILGALRRPN